MRFSLVATVPRSLRAAFAATFVAVMCGCASGPGAPQRASSESASERDGPGANPPADLASRPDAEPRVEPIRSGGANKPYQIAGRTYVPETRDVPFRERGLASWYGRKFHGRRTSSGETYDMYAMTAAHPTLPIPSYARVRNPANGREVLVRVNDRGPFVAGRIVDLSYTAALKLDLLRGVAPVELERITFADIRTGAWRGNGVPTNDVDPPAVQVAAAPPSAVTVPTQDVVPVAALPALVDGGRFWVQLGAFRAREGAETFRSRVAGDAAARWLEPLLVIIGDSAPYRVQAGPYRSRDDADDAAERARAALAIVPVIVERR